MNPGWRLHLPRLHPEFCGRVLLFSGLWSGHTSLRLLCISKPSYHRYRITPHRDRTFLLGMWTRINPADASENSGQ